MAEKEPTKSIREVKSGFVCTESGLDRIDLETNRLCQDISAEIVKWSAEEAFIDELTERAGFGDECAAAGLAVVRTLQKFRLLHRCPEASLGEIAKKVASSIESNIREHARRQTQKFGLATAER